MAGNRRSFRDIDDGVTAGTMTVMSLARKLHAKGVEALVVQRRPDGWSAGVRRPDGTGPIAKGGADIGEALVHLMALIDVEAA